MNISRENLIIAVAIGTLVLVFAGYGINKTVTSNKIVVETGEAINKDSSGLTEQNKGKSGGESKDIFIHVIGSVKNPGVVKIPAGSRIENALQASGGAKEDADLEMVNLAYKLEDGQQVYIPAKEKLPKTKTTEKKNAGTLVNNPAKSSQKPIPGVQTAQTSGAKTVSSSGGGVKADELVKAGDNKGSLININTAGLTELDSLQGIGPATAQKIIDYRNTSGGFKASEDIMKVKGIGKSKYEQIKNKITI